MYPRTRLDERGLEHIGQEGKDGVQGSKVILLTDLAVLNTSEKLSENGQVQDKRSSKEGILLMER